MNYTWDLNPIALSLFGLEVRWYGLAYVAGFFIALHLGYYLWKKHQSPKIEKTALESFVFSTFLVGVLGGRLGLFLFYSPQTFWTNPLQVLKIWEGGMSIHGGLLAAGLWGWWQCRRHGWNPLRIADTFVLPIAIGLGLGRIANFINGELPGRPTDQTWGVIFPHIDEILRHPSQLYAAGKDFALAAILTYLIYRGGLKHPGLLTSVMLIGYGAVRFGLEFFREPTTYFGPLTTGQALCLVMIFVGLATTWHHKGWSK